jgi:hypothetical protein
MYGGVLTGKEERFRHLHLQSTAMSESRLISTRTQCRSRETLSIDVVRIGERHVAFNQLFAPRRIASAHIEPNSRATWQALSILVSRHRHSVVENDEKPNCWCRSHHRARRVANVAVLRAGASRSLNSRQLTVCSVAAVRHRGLQGCRVVVSSRGYEFL